MRSKGHSQSTARARAVSLVDMKDKSPPKKLTRSRQDRYVGGVAAGLAKRFQVDPIFVRIAFVASLVLGGLGLIAYLVLLAVMPVEGDSSEPLPPIEPRRRNMMIALAVIIGVIAVGTSDSGTFGAWLFGFWPGTLFGILFWTAAAGVFIWLLATGKLSIGSGDSPKSPPSAPSGSGSGQAAESSTEVVTYAESPTQLSRTEIMETRQLDTPTSGAGDESRPAPVRDDAPSTIGKIMLWFAIGIAALVVVTTLFVISAGTTALFGGLPMAVVVIALGAGMVFAALRGRRQLSVWLLAAAVAVTLPMAAVSIADLRVEGSYGEIKETPMSVVDIPEDGYRMAAGNMTIDLRRFDFERRGSRSFVPVDLPVRSGMGLTSVIVPDDVCVVGRVEGKVGAVSIRGRQSNGIEVSQSASPDSVRGNPVLVDLDGEFKLGAFEVVDNSQWRQDGRAGSFEENDLDPDDRSSAAARERATAACDATVRPVRGERSESRS